VNEIDSVPWMVETTVFDDPAAPTHTQHEVMTATDPHMFVAYVGRREVADYIVAGHNGSLEYERELGGEAARVAPPKDAVDLAEPEGGETP